MPIGTAFHERTLLLCESLSYREWSGYYAVSSYEPHHEHEYNAIRNAAALIDISPLFKYRLTGKDATRLVDRIITRDMRKVTVGQVVYTPWCDERGKVILSLSVRETAGTDGFDRGAQHRIPAHQEPSGLLVFQLGHKQPERGNDPT